MGSSHISPPPMLNNPLGGDYSNPNAPRNMRGMIGLMKDPSKYEDPKKTAWKEMIQKQQLNQQQGLQVATPMSSFGSQGGDPSMGIITNENRNLSPSSFGSSGAGNQSPYFNANYR